jgi:anti-sigma B factor antagonist
LDLVEILEKSLGDKFMAAEVRERDGILIIKPTGRIIGPAGTELREQISGELEKISGTPKVLIDLADVARIDSSGLGTLVACHVSVARKDGRIGLINIGTDIQNLIVMGRLITIFERFDSEDEAITALNSDN